MTAPVKSNGINAQSLTRLIRALSMGDPTTYLGTQSAPSLSKARNGMEVVLKFTEAREGSLVRREQIKSKQFFQDRIDLCQMTSLDKVVENNERDLASFVADSGCRKPHSPRAECIYRHPEHHHILTSESIREKP